MRVSDISTQEACNALVIPLGLQVCMGGDDYLLFGGSQEAKLIPSEREDTRNIKETRQIELHTKRNLTVYIRFGISIGPHQRLDTWECGISRTRVFFEEVPNAETLSRHESLDCGAKRGLRMRSNADTTNAT
ncbi:hypothetical protein EVAR_45033_1 [Eumeta japonica]|uniref:Uncharacterized protein n=1 Tax=Eumeta variegata TaxID=151549 RepID=A0A4C1YPN1_EUMVA|nr:hypothetical protein EVAR_45033_1 [Eumeta japonica]